jgi:CRISPR system Cascade subunit CasB
MSEEEKNPGVIAFGWWAAHVEPRDREPAARAVVARLRHADTLEVLCEPAVHQLARSLQVTEWTAEKFVRLVRVLAEIRENDPNPLARRLGGEDPVLSRSRFENLMRSDNDELKPLLRRAIEMADRRCNVAALARDLWFWNEQTRIRWCFQYFGVDVPQNQVQNQTTIHSPENLK